MNPISNFMDDPDFFEQNKLFCEATSRQEYLKNRKLRMAAKAAKANKTRKRNLEIKASVSKYIEEEKDTNPLAFLPLEYHDPSRKITIFELIKLSKEFPEHIKVLEETYHKRQTEIKLL